MSDPEGTGQKSVPSIVSQLTDENFESEVASKSAMLVMFYAPCKYRVFI